MSVPLLEILDLASVGSPITCTLSPESVQVILFGLSFLGKQSAWRDGQYDSVTDIEWDTIETLVSNVSAEMLP